MSEFDWKLIPPPPIEDTPLLKLRNTVASAVSSFVGDTGVCPVKIAMRWTDSKSGTNCLDALHISFDSFSDWRNGEDTPQSDLEDPGPEVVYTKP